MLLNTLVPWRKRSHSPVLREENPFGWFHSEMDRMFDRVFSDFGIGTSSLSEKGFTGFHPRIDVHRSDNEIKVTAELPGLEKEDIEIKAVDGRLIIGGEKKASKETQEDDHYYMERSYGSFRREIPIGEDVDLDQVQAAFKNGILEITLPRNAVAANVKHIKVS